MNMKLIAKPRIKTHWDHSTDILQLIISCYFQATCPHTVKPFDFARDLILLILQVTKIREIKYSWKFKFYIVSNSKTSTFAKLSTWKRAVIFNSQNLSVLQLFISSNSKYNLVLENGLQFFNQSWQVSRLILYLI